jgi:phenylalanyl-tRNA synthetase beta chain
MRVPLGWLRDYVDLDLSPEALAERLTLLGFEVKGLERWGSEWRNVVVGELLTVQKHPRADRLWLTTANVGEGEPLQIVCGATNIAPGQRVPVALPGALLPGNRAIERTEKMGVVSNGMLCSGDELRLSVDGEGILILPVETPLGTALTDLYGDWVLDVDVKPNRGDALCLVGLAREVAAVSGSVARFPEIRLREDGPPIGEVLAVGIEDPALCHRFVGRRVNAVRVAPSPEQVQRRLLAAGMRPVSNVVDATNYAMLELGKPTHAFDAGAVARDATGRAALVVRTARPGERLETLDHLERALSPETLVIADANGPLAIAGVMGGAASEVGESTADVIIESAVFDPVSVRRTAFRYALRSEASLRFEKGQESRLARIGADRVAELIAAWAGGSIARGRIDTAPDEPPPARVGYRPARVNRLLGTSLGPDAQAALLARVGILTEPAPDGSGVVIAAGPTPRSVAVVPGEARDAVVPTWRRDLLIEADIAEEVVRLAGYETVAGKTPDTAMPHVRPNPLELRDALRRALVGAGLTEVVTPALVPASAAATLGWPVLAADGVPGEAAVDGPIVTVKNPLSERHAVLRRGLVGSLLDVLALNERHGRGDVAIFEVGKGYAKAPDGAPAEWWRLAFLVAGSADALAWNRPARQYDLDDAKGIVELLARVLVLPDPAWAPHLDGVPLHPGRAAHAVAPGALAGLVGELHPSVLAAWDLRAERVLVAELAILGLSAGQLVPVRVLPIGRFQPLERDLALVVPETLAAADLAATLRAAGGDTLRQVALFDIYRGAPLAAGEKSLAWRVVFAADERALTDEEVDADVARLVSAVASAHGARLRT